MDKEIAIKILVARIECLSGQHTPCRECYIILEGQGTYDNSNTCGKMAAMAARYLKNLN
jgi:hypothetical protein